MSRSQLAVLLALLSALWLSAPGRPGSAASAWAAEATMTFSGALNVAGSMNSITVRPSAVTIPAGGEIALVNDTTTSLTVRVGGKSARLEPDGSVSMLFVGADRAETFSVAATAINTPQVGALTSSAGRITVQAVPVVAMAPGPTAPNPTRTEGTAPEQARATRGTRAAAQRTRAAASAGRDGAMPDDTATFAPAASGAPDATPDDRSGEVITVPPGTSSATEAGHSAASRGAAEPPGSADRRDATNPATPEGARSGAVGGHDSTAGTARGRPADAEVEPVLPPFPGFSSTHDQLGLLVLLTAVALAGIGAALVRTVLAYRPAVVVGAHSQAARKARKARRQRG